MTPNDASPLADTEVHLLDSRHVGDTFKIFVGDCRSTETDLAGLPKVVLYVSDANGNFGGAVDLVRYMQLNAWLPPMLVVGIGYPVGILEETIPHRNRDLTPTRDDWWATNFSGGDVTGGAAQFLAFIRDELQPWVATTYGVEPRAGSTFFGHSSGGLFATYVLLTEPGTFSNYAVASPSYWWDSWMLFGYEEQYAAAHDDLPARVHIATGEHETQAGRERALVRLAPEEQAKARVRNIDFLVDAQRMTTALRGRNYPGLTVENVVLPHEYHNTVPQLALSRALRWFFAAPD